MLIIASDAYVVDNTYFDTLFISGILCLCVFIVLLYCIG